MTKPKPTAAEITRRMLEADNLFREACKAALDGKHAFADELRDMAEAEYQKLEVELCQQK